MSDDADTIREFVAYLASRSKAMDAQDAVDSVEAALGRVVAERDELREYATKVEGERDGWIAQGDELRARLQTAERERGDLGPFFIRDACRVLGIDEHDFLRMDKLMARLHKAGQDLGGASGASSTAALHHVLEEATERWNESGRSKSRLTQWLGLTVDEYDAYVRCRMDDLILIASLTARAGVSGGTTTGSARPPQPDLSASEGERLRHLAEQIISPDALVVGGESEELARGVLRLLARVVLLEEALRRADAWFAETPHHACKVVADIVRAALAGDVPPAPQAPITGSGIDF